MTPRAGVGVGGAQAPWSVSRRRVSRGLRWCVRRARVTRFALMSTLPLPGAVVVSPVLAVGLGSIIVQGSRLGFWPSPMLFDGCIHLEVRDHSSSIEIGPGTTINNGAVMISDGPGIAIGRDCLVGPSVHIYDTDFHALDRSAHDDAAQKGAVRIGDRVFIGTGVTICKGVRIGDGSVVGAGSVVTSDIPPNSVAAGNPCRVIGLINETEGPEERAGTIGLSTEAERIK